MAIAKVQAPDFYVLVGRAADKQRAIGGDVHGQHRKLVPIKRQEELEGIDEQYLDR